MACNIAVDTCSRSDVNAPGPVNGLNLEPQRRRQTDPWRRFHRFIHRASAPGALAALRRADAPSVGCERVARARRRSASIPVASRAIFETQLDRFSENLAVDHPTDAGFDALPSSRTCWPKTQPPTRASVPSGCSDQRVRPTMTDPSTARSPTLMPTQAALVAKSARRDSRCTPQILLLGLPGAALGSRETDEPHAASSNGSPTNCGRGSALIRQRKTTQTSTDVRLRLHRRPRLRARDQPRRPVRRSATIRRDRLHLSLRPMHLGPPTKHPGLPRPELISA